MSIVIYSLSMFPLHFVTFIKSIKTCYVIFWLFHGIFCNICTVCSYQDCNILAGGERAASFWHHYYMSALIISGRAVWLTENCIIGVLGDSNCTNRDNQDNTPCLSSVLQAAAMYTHTHTLAKTSKPRRQQLLTMVITHTWLSLYQWSSRDPIAHTQRD